MPIDRHLHNSYEHLIASPSPELAIVLPTFNERQNIAELTSRISVALDGVNWEIIFVDDDSPDGTADEILRIAANDRRIRLIQRIGRRGLSSACIEGMLASSAPVLAVMDSDMQHDEKILPAMLHKLRVRALDIVIATRNAEGGSMGSFSAKRVLLSKLGQQLSKSISQCELSDPMSGFFMLRRTFFLSIVHHLHGGGFKILLDILASATRPVQLAEIGYCFKQRRFGSSKLDVNIAFEYLSMVLNKISKGLISTRFLAFMLIGFLGFMTHFTVLVLLFDGIHLSFVDSQATAAAISVIASFMLNALISSHDRHASGMQKLTSLLRFCAGCAFGGFVNVTFAEALIHAGLPCLLAAFGGALVSIIWNYSIANLILTHPPRLRTTANIAAYQQSLLTR